MKKWLLLVLSLFFAVNLFAAKNYSGIAYVSFLPSNPASYIYYVEYRRFDGTWIAVASGTRSPIGFIIRDLVPGTYRFRLRGTTTSVQPSTISNEYSYTIK